MVHGAFGGNKETAAAARRCVGHEVGVSADEAVITAAAELSDAYGKLSTARAVGGDDNEAMTKGGEGQKVARGDTPGRVPALMAAEARVMAAELAHEQAVWTCVHHHTKGSKGKEAAEDASKRAVAAHDAAMGRGMGQDGNDVKGEDEDEQGGSLAEKALAAGKAAAARLQAAKDSLAKERRLWEEAVVRLVRPRSCQQLQALATGSPSGLYTVFPPGEGDFQGLRVFCDMQTDGGGWTLVGWGPDGSIGGPLGVSGGDESAASQGTAGGLDKGSPSPLDRSRPGRVNALWLVESAAEMGISWIAVPIESKTKKTSGVTGPGEKNGTATEPTGEASSNNTDADASPAAEALPASALSQGTIGSYGSSIALSIPAPGRTDLALSPAPPAQSCSDDRGDYAVTRVRCLHKEGAETGPGNSSSSSSTPSSSCPFPERMYTGATSLGVCGGHSYGVVLMGGGPGDACDGPLLANDGTGTGRTSAKVDKTKFKTKGSGSSSGSLRIVDDGMGVFVGVDSTPGCSAVAGTNRQVSAISHVAVWVR